jgi:hypothetical protein
MVKLIATLRFDVAMRSAVRIESEGPATVPPSAGYVPTPALAKSVGVETRALGDVEVHVSLIEPTPGIPDDTAHRLAKKDKLPSIGTGLLQAISEYRVTSPTFLQAENMM